MSCRVANRKWIDHIFQQFNITQVNQAQWTIHYAERQDQVFWDPLLSTQQESTAEYPELRISYEGIPANNTDETLIPQNYLQQASSLIEEDTLPNIDAHFLTTIPTDIYRMSQIQLDNMRQMITSQQVSIRQIILHFHCGSKMIHRVFEQHNLALQKLQPGVKARKISEDVYMKVLRYKARWNTGLRRTTESLNDKGIQITEWQVRAIFEFEGLFQTETDYEPPRVHTNRFVAEFANQLWHTDLHYWKKITENGVEKQTYIIAFLDDRTRYIIHHEILQNKDMHLTSSALQRALDKGKVPHMITIDNGKEFCNTEFSAILQRYHIKEHRTHPYNPEENGKIERWWGTLERTIIDETKLDKFVKNYNTVWKHSALKSLTGESMTPQQAWDSMQHHEGHLDPKIIYN
jgi:transposase InsO family protein